jgi:hypothetical protein
MEGEANGVVPIEVRERMHCLKTDYAVQPQQEGYPRQGLLSGLWHEPQWEAGLRAELFRGRCGGVEDKM